MSAGTTPPGAAGEDEAARWVRRMFASVAHRYDLLNHLLSFNADRSWRRRTVERVAPVLAMPSARILDLCCGTGDLVLALEARRGAAVWGCDFCRPMLEIARRKFAAAGSRASLIEADVLRLPLPSNSLDLVTVAFGFRNLASYRAGLEEMARVLRPGGLAAILEFSRPPSRLFARLYDLYSRRVLPAIGGALSGSREAYTYLPDSVRRFPDAETLAAEMRGAGFDEVTFERLTAGIVALHLGRR
ncbi:MAG TPA: bifunctional demethylmenaquinone methyltransferase/2-methoxy-6-polyprenyl-1,4-benzoquinol methylase UbiE [Bryobacteraceae bacterium]|nr:bifunctional demethylmenaquinone methyltransferase/2-methoxy-6-polyprenyl-1,4-benzoquinol methylase UbiE [Bryobacteraceae bacterium]